MVYVPICIKFNSPYIDILDTQISTPCITNYKIGIPILDMLYRLLLYYIKSLVRFVQIRLHANNQNN